MYACVCPIKSPCEFYAVTINPGNTGPEFAVLDLRLQELGIRKRLIAVAQRRDCCDGASLPQSSILEAQPIDCKRPAARRATFICSYVECSLPQIDATQFCFVLFSLQLSVCLWWHDYRKNGLPTLKFVVVIADPLAIC